MTDQPTYTTRLSLGTQQKFVVDYGGRLNGPNMPRSVADLEDAIDAVAGSASRVKGKAGQTARRVRP